MYKKETTSWLISRRSSILVELEFVLVFVERWKVENLEKPLEESENQEKQ